MAGLAKDSEDLVKSDLGAINVPKPFAMVMIKLFLHPG